MSAWRPARAEELEYLWPAARAAHVAPTRSAFEAMRREAPWRIRVSDSGDAMVLRPWRAHLDILSLRAAWAPSHRIAWLIGEARSVAEQHGFSTLLSPLLAEGTAEPYLATGMSVIHRLIALQGAAARVSAKASEAVAKSGAALRMASQADVAALVELDAECFDTFWRYGVEEFEAVFGAERIVVAEDEAGFAGYASSAVIGSTVTLGRLAVASRARRRGVGSALVADAAASGVAAGALGIGLCTQMENHASRALYARLGLAEIAEPYLVAAMDASVDAVSAG